MNHNYFMKKALSLASRGRGKTSPNPMVGAVLVKNGEIIGKGYHRKYGSIHAEIEALNDAYKRDPAVRLADNAILYVTLEPCCHSGRGKINPPCCDRIISEQIPEVVIASVDPNPLVSGRGIEMLKKAGIKVTSGILEEDEKNLNRIDHHCEEHSKPFILLKTAQTIDSFTAKEDGSSKWISNTESRKEVHRLRSEYDAVMIASNTVQKDDPELTVRHVRGRQPLRIVLDTSLKTAENSRLLNDAFKEKSHIFYNRESAPDEKIICMSGKKYSIHPVSKDKSGKLSLEEVIKTLWGLGVRSILVEGGSLLASELLKKEMINRISFFISPQFFLRGIPAFRFHNSEYSGYLSNGRTAAASQAGKSSIISSRTESEGRILTGSSPDSFQKGLKIKQLVRNEGMLSSVRLINPVFKILGDNILVTGTPEYIKACMEKLSNTFSAVKEEEKCLQV